MPRRNRDNNNAGAIGWLPPRRAPFAALAAISLSMAFQAGGDELAADDRRGLADGLMARGLYALAVQEYASLASDGAAEGRDLVLSRLAECQRRTGDSRAAAATCAAFMSEFPASPQRFNASVTYALALADLGDAARSSSLFDEISTDPAAPRELRLSAMYFAGENYFKAGDMNSARSRLSMLVSSAVGDIPESVKELRDFASLYLAEIEAAKGGGDATGRALDAYARIAAAPATPRIGAEALFKGACLAYSARRNDEAVARFTSLFARYPGDTRVGDARLPATWANFAAGRFADAAALADAALADSAIAGDPARKAEALYVKAASTARTGNATDALGAFARLLAECPGSRFDADARYERLVLLFRSGGNRQLLEEAAAFASPPESLAPDVLWLQAEAAEALGDSARASQFYSMLAARHPKSQLAAEALYRSARHLREEGALADASTAFRRLALNHSGSPLVPYALYESGCCLLSLGRFEDSVRDLTTLLENHPGHALEPEAMLQKGVAQRNLGLARDAGATFDALAASHPDSAAAAKARFERARIFYDGGDYAEAERLLRPLAEDASATQEARREASFLLGLALHAQGREDDAAALFQPLLEGAMRGRLPVDRLLWLAEFQHSRGRYAQVAEAADELLARDIPAGTRQAANVLAARSRLAMGATNEAAAFFRAAAESPARTRFSAEAALRLAEILDAAGDSAESRSWFSKAVELAGGDGQESVRAKAYLGLAASHEKAGETAEAIRLYLAVSLLFDGGDEVKGALEAAEGLLRSAGRSAEADAVREDLRARFGRGDGQ